MSEFESITLARLAETGIIAVLRAPTPEFALGTVEALVAGGITGIEVTYSTPGAAVVIAECAHRYGTDILLGAGTVTTAAQAEEAVEAGAEFLSALAPSHRLQKPCGPRAPRSCWAR